MDLQDTQTTSHTTQYEPIHSVLTLTKNQSNLFWQFIIQSSIMADLLRDSVQCPSDVTQQQAYITRVIAAWERSQRSLVDVIFGQHRYCLKVEGSVD